MRETNKIKELRKINPTLARVEQYKLDLQKGVHEGLFNKWAFLFSLAYFIYLGMLKQIFIFAFLPWIISFPLSILLSIYVYSPETLTGPLVAILCGHIIAHLIAGFTANSAVKKYKKQYIIEFLNVQPDAEVSFFAISKKRLVILSLLSGGYYLIYWVWRNWKNYREATHSDVSPFWAAFFMTWTMPFLMKRMSYSLKSKKNYMIYGVFFFLLCFVSDSIDMYLRRDENINNEVVALLSLTSLILYVSALFLLFPAQNAVNIFTKEKLGKSVEKTFYTGEVVFTIIGLLMMCFNLFS